MLAVAAILTLSGCASVQLGSPEKTAEVKKLQAKLGVGQVFVCRDGSIVGMAIRPDVELDGKAIGTVARKTFAYQEVQPGEHTLVVKTLEHDSTFPFKIAAGEQKFFQIWISVGVIAGRGIVDEMDPAKAKDCIAGGEMVEATAK